MWLVILFIIVVIWLGHVLPENAEIKQTKYDSEAKARLHKSRYYGWRNKVVDMALTENLGNFIRDRKNANEVWESVRGAYEQMPHHRQYESCEEWDRDGLSLTNTKYGYEKYSERRYNEALDIMLAQNGKVRKDSILCKMSPGFGDETKNEWDKRLEFWTYIQNELRRHGVNAKLIFDMDSANSIYGDYFDMSNIQQFRYKGGELLWLPCAWCDDNLNAL